MAHDRNHQLLKAGDRVLIPCVVARIQEDQEETCNLTLHTVHRMPKHTRPSSIALNGQQVLLDSNPAPDETEDATFGGLVDQRQD